MSIITPKTIGKLEAISLFLTSVLAGSLYGCASVPPVPQGYVHGLPQSAGTVDAVVQGGLHAASGLGGGPSGGVELDPYITERLSLPISAWGGILDDEVSFGSLRIGIRNRLEKLSLHTGAYIGGAVGVTYLRLSPHGNERDIYDSEELRLSLGDKTFGWSAEIQAGITLRYQVVSFSASIRPSITDSGATFLTGWIAGNTTLVIFVTDNFGITGTLDMAPFGLSFPRDPDGGRLIQNSIAAAALLGLTWSGPPPDDPSSPSE